MRSKQANLLQDRVDQGVVAMNGYNSLPKASRQELHH